MPAETSVPIKAERLVELSKLYQNIDLSRAIDFSHQAILISKTGQNDAELARSLTQRALLYWLDGKYDSSILLNKKSIKIKNALLDTLGASENYHSIGMNYYYSADYDSAIRYFEKAYAGFTEYGNTLKAVETLNLIGLVYHQLGNYPEAIKYLHKFSGERKKLKGYKGRTYNLGNTTPYFRAQEYFENELSLQLRAIKNVLARKDEEKILLTYLNIADTYKELSDYSNALKYHKIAYSYSNQIGVVPEYNFIGNAYRAVGLVDSAIFLHELGLTQFKKYGTRLEVLYSLVSLGKDYEQRNDLRKALLYYKDALAFTSSMNNKLDMVINSYRVADMFSALGNYDSAKFFAEKALAYSIGINAKSYVRDCYKRLADIEAHLNQTDSAYHHLSASRELADVLIAGEASLQFAQMQAEFELKNMEEHIALLSSEKERQEVMIRNRELFIAATIIVLLLAGSLIISIYLRFRQKNRANKILQTQKQQIQTLLAEIHHRVKNNLQVISSLLSIQSDQLKNKNARMAVLEGQSRVQAMGLIHENIYKTENFAFINMNDYIEKLSEGLVLSFGSRNVTVKVNADNISVDVDTAIPLGLIINELLTNSLKHAFERIGNPSIEVDMRVQSNALSLVIRDNGVGYLAADERNSFGLKLVKELTEQLHGTIEFKVEGGFIVSIYIKKFKLAA